MVAVDERMVAVKRMVAVEAVHLRVLVLSVHPYGVLRPFAVVMVA